MAKSVPPDDVTLGELAAFHAIYTQVRDHGTGLQDVRVEGVSEPRKVLNRLAKKLGLPRGKKLVDSDRGKRARPTGAGDLLFEAAAEALGVRSRLAASSLSGPGRLSIIANPSIIAHFLPHAFARCGFFGREEFFGVPVSIDEGYADEVVRAVETRAARIGLSTPFCIHSRLLREPECVSDVARVLLYAEGHSFKARRTDGEPVRMDWLARETVFVPPPGAVPYFPIEDILPRPVPRAGGRRVVVPTADQMYAFVKADLGVCFGNRELLPAGDEYRLTHAALPELGRVPNAQVWLYLRDDWEPENPAEEFFVAALRKNALNVAAESYGEPSGEAGA